jgi:CDP-L-myo-inositol myo-inositolphosphotransferase
LLRFPAVRPLHGTILTAAIAIIMIYFLIQGTQQGLMIGAILFQLASIIDGVDGEIARATFRSTPQGAMIDSLIDATANLGFIGGVTLNLYMQSEIVAAKAGVAGLVMLATGLTLIGFRGRKNEAGLTFNAVKEHFSAQRSRVMTWLTWLTMRDFFALVGAVLILAGFGPPALILFAVVTTGWLAVVMAVMFRQAA